MTPRRVLVFTPTVGRGGVHLVVERLTQALAATAPAADWSFAVLGQRQDELGAPVAYPAAWPVAVLDHDPPPGYDFAALAARAETYVAALAEVAADYDLIWSPAPWWVMHAGAWPMAVPFVATVADFAFDHFDMGPLTATYRRLAQRLAERAALVICPSEFQREHGANRYRFARTRAVPYSADFVPAGYAPSDAEAARVRARYGLPERYVLAFHCYGHKDVVTIIRAQQRARAASAAVPPLVLAGLETELYLANTPANGHVRAVQTALRDAGATLGGDVFILGTVPDGDLAGLHAGATLAVQASRSEGDVSGAANAAILARCPLVHSDLPVYRARFGATDRYALRFPVSDSAALSRAVIAVAEQPQAAARRAARALQWAAERSAATVALDYLDAFQSVLDREPAR